MAEPVRAWRLADQEGQWLQQIVRRGKARVGPGAAGDDHHGVGVGHAGAGDRTAGRCR